MNNAPHGRRGIGALHDFREEACIVYGLDVRIRPWWCDTVLHITDVVDEGRRRLFLLAWMLSSSRKGE